MKRKRLLTVLVPVGAACVAGIVALFVLTDKIVLAPFAGIAALVAVVCALIPVWLQHR
ncbi:MAG: hypothetical protein ACK5P8_01340 [Phycisphaerae bacterium]